MPEGPTVRRFCSLASPFVSQLVVEVGGSTKQITPQDLKRQRFLDCRVHGKNLYLAFGSDLKKHSSEDASYEAEEGGAHTMQAVSSQSLDYPLSEETSGEESERPSGQSTCIVQGSLSENQPWKWLRFHFGLFGSIRANEFSRARQANKRGDWRDATPRLILRFDTGGFLVFYNCRMTWCSSPASEPACDILSPEFDRERAVRALSQPRPVCYTLMDQRCFSGVGNIIKNEILYLAQIHPLSFGSLLPLENLRSLRDYALSFTSDWLRNKMQRKGLHYHIYMKEYCAKGHRVTKETLGPPNGLKRLTWYCPACQPQVKLK
ncbi:endonuclease 8-like 2 [Ascaphus truei]|uniref:endonuclease 8-like 2 n=1 Tax=Ascaphus truei TaxID=8439 RepID=UPI003F5A659F